MIDYNWKKTLSGERTQIRLPVKPNHHALNVWRTELGSELRIGESGDSNRIGVVQALGRDIYLVGKTYAIQPEYRKRAVARIRILSIRREDVRQISIEDAKAEGFDSRTHFLLVWMKMHDPEFYQRYPTTGQISLAGEQGLLATRPAERYEAWVLTFEVVNAKT